MILSLVLFSVVGYGISILPYEMKLPFGMETLFTAIVFFGMGSLWTTHYQKKSRSQLKRYALPLLVVSLATCAGVATLNFNLYNQQIDLRLNHLGNYFFFYIAAISGILGIVIFSKILKKNFLLEYIGRYSLGLFALHPLAFFYFTEFITLIINEKTFNNIHDLYFSPLYTVGSIVMILFLMYLMRKFHSLIPFFHKHH